MFIDDSEESGVDAVALVDRPAIERNWMAFRGVNRMVWPMRSEFKIADEEKRRVMGPLMVADQPVYRVDPKGKPYYCVFSAPTIEAIVKKFMKMGYTGSVNEMHNSNMVAKDCYMIESFIIDSKRGIKTPEGFAELPDGSWFGTYQIDNEEIWSKIKAGEFMGFSVEGWFGEQKVSEIDATVAEELINALIKEK